MVSSKRRVEYERKVLVPTLRDLPAASRGFSRKRHEKMKVGIGEEWSGRLHGAIACGAFE